MISGTGRKMGYKNILNIVKVWVAVREKKNPFLFCKITQKKYSSSLNRQPSETKPNTKMILKLTYFKVRNHYFVQNFKRLIYFKSSTFVSLIFKC